MSLSLKNRKQGAALKTAATDVSALAEFVPSEVLPLDNPQTDLPRIARDEKLIRSIEEAIQQVPTAHAVYHGDAREMAHLESESVHLVVTSPPYWTLKEYRSRISCCRSRPAVRG
jgi:hypothetical protein